MYDDQNGQLAFAHFLGVLYRHKKKAVATFLCVCLASVLLILFMKRTYASEAKLFVKVGRESVTLDPTATTGQTVMIDRSQESEINSILEILNGQHLAQQIVDHVGVDKVMEKGKKSSLLSQLKSKAFEIGGDILDSFSVPVASSESSSGAGIPTAEEEQAVRRVLKSTEAWAPKISTVITIQARAGTPKLAQEIAQAKVDLFIQDHLRLNRTSGSFNFFTEQSELDAQQLQDSQEVLQQALSDCNLLSVGGQRETLEQKLRDIQLAILTTDRQLALAGAKNRSTLEAMAGLPREIVSERSSGHPNEARDMMRGALYELEISTQELLQTYSKTHPYVESVKEQRRDLAEILEKHPTSRIQQKTSLNPTRQALELVVKQQEIELNGLMSQRELLNTQLAATQQELKQLNEQSVLIAALERDVQIAEANYRAHADKLEQARIDTELGEDRISNVNVVQPATYVRKAVRPNKLLILAGGLLMGLFGALAVVLSAEYTDTSLRTAEQTEAHLGMPVLLSVPPESRLSADRLTKGVR